MSLQPSILRAGHARARCAAALSASASASRRSSLPLPLRTLHPARHPASQCSRHLSTRIRPRMLAAGSAASLVRVRRHTTKPGEPGPSTASASAAGSASGSKVAQHDHDHDHDHEHHGLFHSHSHDHGHSEGAEQIMEALRSGKLDRGTKITLLGLGSNIALTITKGVAGLLMNSASLLAEAGHSLSDLLGDFVTLATWRISRRPPSDRFPWGYSKFETIGSMAISVILIGGALGIGLHSYHLLLQTLIPWLEALPSDHILAGLQAWLPSSVPSPLLELFHSHGVSGHEHVHALSGDHHGHDHGAAAVLNPHAAWFALASVGIKEWLYQITNKVAKEEHSPVLKANALHHRADALTSLVALGSIVGSSLGGVAWLDPVGGIAVSFFILQQGLNLTKQATMELLDVGIDAKTQRSIEEVASALVDGKQLLACRNVRGVKSGGLIQLDLTIVVPANMSVRDSHAIEIRVRDAITAARKEAREVKIHVHGEDLPFVPDQPLHSDEDMSRTPPNNGPNNDFTRHGC